MIENETAPQCAEVPPGDTRPTWRQALGRFWIVALGLAVTTSLFTLLRVVLLLKYAEPRSIPLIKVACVFFVGLRFDLFVGLVLLLPLSVHMAVYGNRRVQSRVSRLAVHAGLFVSILITVLLCCTEYLFFDEFKSRLNYLAFEYLAYPTEVFGNIWQSYPVTPLVAGIVGLPAAIYLLLRKHISPLLRLELAAQRRWGLLAANFAAVLVLWLTIGMASMQISQNRLANECAGNGLYTVVYYAWSSRVDFDDFYMTRDLAAGYDRVQKRIAAPGDKFEPNPANPLDRTVNPSSPRRDWNVVIILEESLGSDFIGALGEQVGLTPHFDALCREGVLFDRFYATGNRTARALEAILASLPPIPAESILKRDHSDHVYTLAHVLADRGYQREFIYGGRGIFDGMRPFMLANGFEQFIERSDYPAPTFVSSWGVCDEDILHKSLDEFDRMQARGKPFFATVLTVSNHIPFIYPDGRIDRPSSEQRRDNAVKYADWAIGDFFTRARSHAFFSNTMFVILGDHGARVYGAQRFPVKSYRVPVLMLLPDGEGAGTRCSTLGSSLDIGPTIMGALGGSYRSVFYGRDVRHIDPQSGYALMQHNNDVAMLTADDQLAVLGCQKTAHRYKVDRSDFYYHLQPDVRLDRENPQLQDTIAFYQTANHLYYSDSCFPAR